MNAARSNWSYDAPTTHIDFGNLQEDDDPMADYWFDRHLDQDSTTAMPAAVPLVQDQNFGMDQNEPATVLAVASAPQNQDLRIPEDSSKTESQLQLNKEDASAQDAASKPPPCNLVTSLEEWRAKSSNTSEPLRRSTRRPSEQLRKQLGNIRAARRSQDMKAIEPPDNKKARLDATGKCSNSRGRSQGKQKMSFGTPTVLRRQQHMSSKGKSTEELEMEKIAQFQKEMAEQRKLNEESLKLAISGAGQSKKIVQIPTTKPLDIKFHTDKRIHAHEGQVYKEVNFTSELRKHRQSPAREHKGPTVPKPFNFSCGNKRKHAETDNKEYVSLAQQIEAFQSRTPPRYHLRSSAQPEGPSKVPAKVKLTKPYTPLLTTKTRSRPPTCKSAVEKEAEELEKIQSYKFKAQEVNSRIMEGCFAVPKKPHVKETTKPIGFDLEIEKRIREREEIRKTEEVEEYSFHSRPCPSKILDNVVGVPEKKPRPVTMPKSPAFTLKNRVRISYKEEEKEEAHVIKANPMPHYAVPFKPKSTEEKALEIQPFSFEVRDKEREALKQKKIEQIRKKTAEVPVFKARMLPDFEASRLPDKVMKPVTKVEPFHLRVEERGAMKDKEWSQMMKEELRKQKEAACFKARPNSVANREPFQPKKADQSLTERFPSMAQEKFELATEKRAKERMEFEMRKSDDKAMREKFQQEKKKEAENNDKDETSRLRQELVHKANPVRHYKTVDIKPSDKPLTVAHTPHFSERFRL
ncbi:targeting protein for Xklp2 [Amblyraja radiata]|uniref:targeting protein for Xklp2 n=1 Tax=Amblyraja radiata TaxID=386614 RepID=UPI001403FE22|nr:targeting protein for Xklp2 [Amblyraja radiata]